MDTFPHMTKEYALENTFFTKFLIFLAFFRLLKPIQGGYSSTIFPKIYLILWLSKERSCCRINFATFRLLWARSLCCLSKEFASKTRKKFLDGQWNEGTHGKRKVAQLKWQLLLFVERQSINVISKYYNFFCRINQGLQEISKRNLAREWKITPSTRAYLQ